MSFNPFTLEIRLRCLKCLQYETLSIKDKRINYYKTKTFIFGKINCKTCGYESSSNFYPLKFTTGKLLLKELRKNANKKK